MKIKIDMKKGAEAVAGALQKTADVGKELGKKAADAGTKAAKNIQDGTKVLAEKNRSEAYLRRLKKYNPLFPEEYASEEFHLPNMIVIKDDAVRRGIDVCEGAIGWRSTEGKMEVLYLYDEAVKDSGLTFVPTADCDAIYYVDKFDRKRFVRVDCIFSKAHEEKMAELKHIANALGANFCSIELAEATVEKSKKQGKKSLSEKGPKIMATHSDQSYERSEDYAKSSERRGRITAKFGGGVAPKRPELKWFREDDTIRQLIDERFGGNPSESVTLEISGTSTATMGEKTACEIDAAVRGIGGKGKLSMETQASKESSTKLIYTIEF